MKKYKIFFIVAVVSLFFGACQYDFIVEPELPPIDNGGNGEETVMFSTQILPIFTSAGCTSCHKSGGQAPNLSSDAAYSSIANAKYLNTTTPAESYFYVHIYSDANAHKHHKFSAAEAQLILTWIQEGAKNN